MGLVASVSVPSRLHHLHVSEFREVTAQLVLQLEVALLIQLQRGNAGDDFGVGIEIVDGIPGNGSTGFQVSHTGHMPVNFLVMVVNRAIVAG